MCILYHVNGVFKRIHPAMFFFFYIYLFIYLFIYFFVCVCVCVCVLFCFLPKTDLDTHYNRLLEVHVYESGRFYGTSVPEVPLKEKDGVLKAILLNKVGA